MDRNELFKWRVVCQRVALRKESVDRNRPMCTIKLTPLTSLSARRAWIEISVTRYKPTPKPSLSARRAWIEIRLVLLTQLTFQSRSPQGERG